MAHAPGSASAPSPHGAPRERDLVANGLRHHLYEWGHEAGQGARGGSVVLLLHGFLDAAGSWDLVAPHLASAGHRVIAPDFRGFGDGPRVPDGAYYHFPDYVADVAAILDALGLGGARLAVVGHSMGGTVATYFAGAFPERVARLAVLEGLGPPDNAPDVAPDRVRRWIDDLTKLGARAGGRVARLASEEDAFVRLRAAHPGVDHAVLRSRVPHLTRRDASGALAWRYDVLHRSTSPFPFFASGYRAFAARVTCPVLFVGGGATGFHPPDEAERLAAFQDLRRIDFEGAGHMIHWTRPVELARALVEHLG